VNTYEYAVLIGRFQPFHIGHENLFRYALSIANHVILVIGSHNSPVSIRNPWDSKTREHFVRLSLSDVTPDRFTIITIADSAYNFNDWVIRVLHAVSEASHHSTSVAIVGHYKDDTSYYLSYFPQWKLDILPSQAGGISSTAIRNACFENRLSDVKEMISANLFLELQKWMKSDHYKGLLEEYLYIRNYRKKWENSPYPPTFVTADPVVFALGHVLLIKRKINPGKSKYALPGGFVKQTETIEHASLRLLREITCLQLGYKELRGSIKMSHVFDHPTRDARGRVISHAIMFELHIKELPEIKAGDDASEVLWCPLYKLSDFESQFFNDHAQIIKFFVNRMI